MKRLYRVFIQNTAKPATYKPSMAPKGALVTLNLPALNFLLHGSKCQMNMFRQAQHDSVLL